MVASGVYGTTIPSRITTDDVEIFYSYHETRNSDSTEKAVFTKLPSSILSNVLYDSNDNFTNNTLEGLYNLKLPLRYFNRKGFYTVYIKPRELTAIISDVSNLAAYPNVRGIILDSKANGISDAVRNRILSNNALVIELSILTIMEIEKIISDWLQAIIDANQLYRYLMTTVISHIPIGIMMHLRYHS